VSDISLEGLGLVGALAALATMAIGAVGALLCALVALASTVPEGDRRSLRVRRFVAGPFACAVFGAATAGFAFSANRYGQILDDVAIAFPLTGIGLWIGVALKMRRRAP
jgi:hypothetical protein